MNSSIERSRNVPQLRFPEFKGEWEKKKLGEVAEISSGGTPSRTNPDYWNGNIPWVSTTLIDFNFIDKTEEYITEEGLKNSSAKLFPKGTLLMAMYGQGKTRGKVSILNIEASTNQACGAIITNNRILDSTFAFQNLAKRYDEIRDLSNQGGQENLSGAIIKGIEIFFPTLLEQTKIASFLTAVDEKLQALKKKKSLLEQYKKGVMQSLFLSEAEFSGLKDEQDVDDTNPKILKSSKSRFRQEDGSDFPAWGVKKLGEVCKIARSGGTPTSTNKSFYNGDIPFLSISDMTSQGKYLTHTSNHISKLGLENSSSWLVPANSLIYSMYASVGFVAINKIPIATSQAVLNLILQDEFDLEFMYYILVDFQKNIAQFITTGTQGNLNAQSVKNFELKMPSLPEQIKIASFLSSIDEKINQTQTQITQTETWKKGLLQKMFC